MRGGQRANVASTDALSWVCAQVKLYAVEEGTVVFPKVPLMRIEGPLLLVQLMETPFLTLVNFARCVVPALVW